MKVKLEGNTFIMKCFIFSRLCASSVSNYIFNLQIIFQKRKRLAPKITWNVWTVKTVVQSDHGL
jgi:hypothetical protein